MPRKLCIKGTVLTGKGEGSSFINLRWVKEQIIEKLGFTPYPGTLNLELDDRGAVRLRETLKKEQSIEIIPQEGFYKGACFKACIMNSYLGGVIMPQIASYPKRIIEVVAPVNLRDALGLEDGDLVEVLLML